MTLKEAKFVFENQLSVMKKEGFIDVETYEKVSDTSKLFYQTRFEQIKEKEEAIKEEQQRM
ncbi:hypothetical protein [Clostridium grantii]|uniref:Uncharacterized protein n=1 Tax=Clostridium grantii DSM 8605 TaxID=1121316 RepID=A0A1M5XNP5_9CLOT|nr:hypothetical protein [Clostridium grantii]SHI00853.1 hypothetical protein SAMN02745207_03773 [Clostridium grantii DSM 8605]